VVEVRALAETDLEVVELRAMAAASLEMEGVEGRALERVVAGETGGR